MSFWKKTVRFFYVIAYLSLPAYGAEIVQLRFVNDADVFSALKPISTLKKDQYEKSTDFTNRICAATYKALGVNEKTLITLAAESGEYATHPIYNADQEAFLFHVGGVDHYAADASYEDKWRWEPNVISYIKNISIQLASKYIEAPKPYIGKNGFGVEREVKVGFQNEAVLYLPGQSYKTNIILPAKPDEAKKLNGDLRLAIATRIQSPCFVVGHGHKSPTLSYLYDMTTDEMGIVGSAKSEWILYRASNKEILKRGKFK